MTNQNISNDEFKEIHSLMGMLQNLDVGLVVLDREYNIQLWNNFMESHSGMNPYEVRNQNLFSVFPEINQVWFTHKAECVFQLNTRAFTTWEQRPYLFKFKNYRPITGSAEFMYQNTTIIPLDSATGQVERIGIIVYDVTDVAVNKLELKAINSKFKQLSRVDKLTGLYNRGYWEECLISEFKRAKRTEQPCSLVMFDIDHFKTVNDKYGHPAGDVAIKFVSDALVNTIRETDIAGRYGGEEFAAILINSTAEQAAVFAERLREYVEQSILEYQGIKFNFTISLGVAEVASGTQSHNEWLDTTDHALYYAKEHGRNQVHIATKQKN
ncbi:GGDEF domain-containing protein [Catenovulum sp. 2E275]|uniref:sensor domain-containing diguanylate cyclase n=1 Tax=Catenovulum sp. 2E275 TaxID=2980497 RepID=UPI0021CF7BF9|nr:sensor domain-containing diguanylate cyclase [Catenovulum sp. 2E275]MCU4677162.1 GGDEF domain-containing protein [Catenovulum sp. 2E275]